MYIHIYTHTENCYRIIRIQIPHYVSEVIIRLAFSVGFSDGSVGKETTCNAGDPRSIPGEGKIRWRRDRLPIPVFLDFPCGSAGKESACNAGDLGSTPGLGRSPREGKGYPLQYSGLENSKECIVHGVAKSQTGLSDFHFHALEREMATHSSVLAWRIPGTEEPSGLPSMGPHRVRHD